MGEEQRFGSPEWHAAMTRKYGSDGYGGRGTTATNIARAADGGQAAIHSGPSEGSPESLWASRPNRKGITDSQGNLDYRYQLSGPGSRISDLDKRLAGVTDLSAGSNFQNAESDVANLRTFANSQGDSPWAAAARDKLSADQQGALQNLKFQQAAGRDQLSNQYGAQVAGGLNMLGASGGFDGGSRERMIQSANKNKMLGQQGLHRTGQMARSGIDIAGMQGGAQIGMQDAGMKFGAMQALPGQAMGLEKYQTGLNQYNNQLGMDKVSMWQNQANTEDQRRLAIDQWNMSNKINDRNAANQWGMNQWMQKGQLYGSNASSDAMANAGGSDFSILNPGSWF